MPVAAEGLLPLAVRSGGHSFPGQSVCDGGIVVDLSPLRGIRLDPERRTARAQARVLPGELAREPKPSGRRCRPGSSRTPGSRG
ncbi:FAD-binding protein [Streptomyces sp. NPDC046876]|uniref:FAD-binding protein n=1 Tax=Streptomyces sp. NPDC046876 TaxID=3155616 RepID=UPI0033DF414D